MGILPWIHPIIHSVEIPGIGKVQLQEFEERLSDVEGATKSTEHKIELVNIEGRETAKELTKNEAANEILILAKEYNHIRDVNDPGEVRTSMMTSIMRKMIDISPMLDLFDLPKALDSTDGGQRLTAYGLSVCFT